MKISFSFKKFFKRIAKIARLIAVLVQWLLLKLLTVKTISIPVCVFLLYHQSLIIFKQYLQQNYVTNIKFVKNYVGPLPAVTICYDKYLSFKGLFERLPDKDSEEYYEKLMGEVDDLTWNQINDQEKEKINKMMDEHSNLQDNLMNNLEFPFLYSKLSDYQDFFENLTMHGTIIENNQTRYLFSPSLTGHIMYVDQDDNSLTYLLNKTLTIEPIESMFFWSQKQTPPRKCFTLFSALDRQFRKMKANLKQLVIPVYFPKQWFPYQEEYFTYIAVHSPDIMPFSRTFLTMSKLGEYSIVYSKVENQEIPGVASCDLYDLDYKNGNYNMKSDCHFQCLINHYGTKCHVTLMMKQKHLAYRRTQFPGEVPNITCDLGHEEWFFKEEECQRKCPDECHQEYYFVDIKMTDQLPSSIPLKNRSLEINIVPSSRPKIVINHLPEMTLMSLVCNFGGLLGIWLGVSALASLNYCWKIFKFIFSKLTTINSFTNEKLFIKNDFITTVDNCPKVTIDNKNTILL